MKIESYIKNFIELIILSILDKVFPPAKTVNDALLFINTGFLGDLLVSSVLCENDHLFSKYKRVVFVLKKQYEELFYDYSGKIEFIGYDYKKYKYSLFYKCSFLKRLRSFGFAKVFNLTAARGILSEEITLLSGAVEKYCLNKNKKYLGEFIGNFIEKRYTGILTSKTFNEYEKHFEVLKTVFDGDSNSFSFFNKNTFKIKNIQEKLNVNLSDKYIVIAPFSLERNRDWPTEYFKEIIDFMATNYSVVIIGNKEQEIDLIKLKKNFKNVHIEAETLSLNEIPSLISRAQLFIGLDSGISHMALKLGTPIIAIIGGGQFDQFLPYKESQTVRYLYNKMNCFNCEWNCCFEKKDCIEKVSVEEVTKNITQLLISISDR